jgi:hypothetical protein
MLRNLSKFLFACLTGFYSQIYFTSFMHNGKVISITIPGKLSGSAPAGMPVMSLLNSMVPDLNA